MYTGTDILKAYELAIKALPVLSDEEQNELLVEYRSTGDTRLSEQVINSNLKLVLKIAVRYSRKEHELIELIQEGNIGLARAIDKYNPEKNMPFSSYSQYWIKSHILKYLMNNWRIVKYGTTVPQRKLFLGYNKAVKKLISKGVEPTDEAIAEKLEISTDNINELKQRKENRDIYFENIYAFGGKQIAIEGYDQFELLDKKRTLEDLKKKIVLFKKTLSGKDLYVWVKSIETNEMNFAEIGDHFKLTRERIRAINKKLVKNFKNYYFGA